MPQLFRQFVRYVMAGGVAAVAHFAVLIALVELVSARPTVASGIGFCIAGAINYTLQYYWTFGASGAHVFVLSRYVVVTLAMLLVNLLIFWFLNEMLAIHYLIAQVIATGIVVLLNFTINRHWTFASAQDRVNADQV